MLDERGLGEAARAQGARRSATYMFHFILVSVSF
jgi:hypothetical protein